MLSEEEIKNIKEQIIQQIESWQVSEEQKATAINQVESMSSEELEKFLAKNKQQVSQEKQECPFCLIIQGKIPNYKLDENKSSLAVLEINPLSKGHSLVLSKKHSKLASSAFSLANKLAKRIKSKFKPEEVKIENIKIQGHEIVNILPIYKNEKLERKKAEEKELILIQDKLISRKKEKKPEKKSEEKQVLEKAQKIFP